MEVEIEMDKKKKDGYSEYECKRFAEVLMEAEEIKADAKKMKAAQKHIGMMKKQISSISDLRKIANENKDEKEVDEDGDAD